MQVLHFSRQNLQTFDISHAFLPLTIAKLSTFKNGPVFWPTHYLVLLCLFTDCKIRDLELPLYVKFSLSQTALSVIRLHTYRTAYLYKIIADPRKDCGSFVDEKLRALRRRNPNNLNKANIITYYYLVPYRLSTDSNTRDLELP